MIILIFIISFVSWCLASYRIIYLARFPNILKAGILSFIEEIFGIAVVSLIIINHLNFWLLLAAGCGAFAGTLFEVEDFIKWIKKLTK
jgi:hypothetical protein